MSRRGLLLLALGGVALSLAFPADPTLAQADQAATAGCESVVAAAWSVPGKAYRVSAVASGRSCATANVTLTIRAPGGGTLLTFASAAADLPLLFADVASPAGMTAALRRWIEQPAGGRTTRDLPSWEPDEEEPKAGEMVFHPEPLVSRAHYMELRKWGQPAFCFLQGAESEACYALDLKADTLTLIGTQTLPG